jgi:hypothetical protein
MLIPQHGLYLMLAMTYTPPHFRVHYHRPLQRLTSVFEKETGAAVKITTEQGHLQKPVDKQQIGLENWSILPFASLRNSG